jgi:hypothetical protein
MRAVANAVMFEPVWAPDREEELDHERWLADTSIHPLRRIEAALANPKESLAEMMQAFHEIAQGSRGGYLTDASLGQAILQDDLAPMRDRYAADEARETEAEAVTAEEAHWLVDRLGRDGRYDANEHALIDFLRANARSIDPALSEMVAQLEGRQSASVA